MPDADLSLVSRFVSFSHLSSSQEHIAILFGQPTKESSPLVRIHSECLTGDVFGSARCDCGPQLHESLRQMNTTNGIILYLRHEGRGIGLYNKLDAYRMQDQGYDTFEANNVLNFPDDLRDYQVAAEMLHALGVTRVRLITNNPDKVTQLTSHGIEIAEVVPTGVFLTSANERYLRAKVEKAGHRICLSAINSPSEGT